MPMMPPEHFSDIADLQKEFSRAKAAERELEIIRALVANPLAFEAALLEKFEASLKVRRCETCKWWERRADGDYVAPCENDEARPNLADPCPGTHAHFGCIHWEEK